MKPPRPVPERTPTNPDNTPISPNDSDPDCPFCTITNTYPPISPLTPSSTLTTHLSPDHSSRDAQAYILLSTPHVLAFLDILPLTRGHTLIIPRRHASKLHNLTPSESAEIGRVLPLVCRSVMRSVMPDNDVEEVDYNLVQNNGIGAAQVVGHVHWHLVPRYPFDYVPPPLPAASAFDAERTQCQNGHAIQQEVGQRKRPPIPAPEGFEATRVMFGRGQRHYRDDEDAEALVRVMRERVREEWRRSFPENTVQEYESVTKRGREEEEEEKKKKKKKEGVGKVGERKRRERMRVEVERTRAVKEGKL